VVTRPDDKKIVYLVGAGPGRADLITLRGAELIKIADCIIYDKLANPELLRHARPDADIVHAPKRTAGRSFTQQQINDLLLEKARQHKCVVRLKGGDPCIFGRCSEEAIVLADAGIDFEIVPGITAGIAAAGYTGILITDRRYSSQVTFITGREAEGKTDSNIDWNWLAHSPGTIVFYMGVGNLGRIANNLTSNGMPAEMPAAVIANATFPTQRVVKAPLSQIEATCKEANVEPPAIIVIGAAADSDPRLNWFAARPLLGKTIVLTRDTRGNAESSAEIVARGGNPLPFATIKIQSMTDSSEFVHALSRFSTYDWVIFTSRNGVEVFFDAARELKHDARVLAGRKVGVIGSQTAESLAQFGIAADFVPTIFTGRELGRQLIARENLKGRKMLLLRSQLASDELPDVLRQGGADVDDVALYTAARAEGDAAGLTGKITRGEIDWATFASPSSATYFFEQIPTETVNSSNVRIASIGPVTTAKLEKLGAQVDLTAQRHTIDGLIEAIEQTYE